MDAAFKRLDTHHSIRKNDKMIGVVAIENTVIGLKYCRKIFYFVPEKV